MNVMTDIYSVRPLKRSIDALVTVPGSKSYTHRMLIAAALADGGSIIENPLDSDDTRLTAKALNLWGINIRKEAAGWRIDGCGGQLDPVGGEINLQNSGTSMRLLTAVAALGGSGFTLSGSKRMHERPIQDLLDTLNQMGVDARSKFDNHCPPVEICGPPVRGGSVDVNCSISSQFLSALMLIAPYVPEGLDIFVKQGLVSKPYVDITADVMQRFGVVVHRNGYDRFSIAGNQKYISGRHVVDPDASQASYFWAAAAVTGSRIQLMGFSEDSAQGDIRLLDLMEMMGCTVEKESTGIAVTGGNLNAIAADMADMPDVVPTIAVVAAFAEGTSRFSNVGHLAVKESNRLEAVMNGLNRMNISARLEGHELVIPGGIPAGAQIDTYDDHRIAMSFAVAGLRIPGMVIENPSCVEKSFPRFWQVFETLYR